MEKSIFLFRRNPNRGPDDFEHHYINNHALLGKRLTRCLRGYTVNLVGGGGFPAAVTEHWVPTVMDLLTPSIAYDNMDDFNAVLVDDQSMFSGFDLYVVTGEELVAGGPIPEAPLEQATPGAKLIEHIASLENRPSPNPKAVRVVDNVVSHRLTMNEDYSWNRSEPEMGLIRMSWFADIQDVGEIGPDAWLTREYRFIEPLAWDAA